MTAEGAVVAAGEKPTRAMGERPLVSSRSPSIGASIVVFSQHAIDTPTSQEVSTQLPPSLLPRIDSSVVFRGASPAMRPPVASSMALIILVLEPSADIDVSLSCVSPRPTGSSSSSLRSSAPPRLLSSMATSSPPAWKSSRTYAAASAPHARVAGLIDSVMASSHRSNGGTDSGISAPLTAPMTSDATPSHINWGARSIAAT
mmetsp:Transcript_66212/g.209270  ORF Transcript_66212/g.209270 Transcript_66212/m.209270 type:complete len:202 (+) Transcript_66212:755-1360(+)